MLTKGSNLYNFEHDLFLFKKKWMDARHKDAHAYEILQEAHELLTKYAINEQSKKYCAKFIICSLAMINEYSDGF